MHAEVAYPRVLYKDGEPLPGLQEIYESSPDKIAEVGIGAKQRRPVLACRNSLPASS